MARIVSAVALLLIALVAGTSAAPQFQQLRRVQQSLTQLRGHFKQAHSSRLFGAKQQPQQVAAATGSDNNDRNAHCETIGNQLAGSLLTKCGYPDFGESVQVLFDVTSNNTAGLDKVCSSTCQSFLQSLPRQYPECVDADTAKGFSAIATMCSQDNGQYCAAKLKAVNKISCDHLTTEQACNNDRTKDCRWKVESSSSESFGFTIGSCQANPTQDTLQQICTPCLQRFVLLLGSGESGSDEQSTFLNYENLLCSKQDGLFCYPLFANLDDRVFDVSPKNNLSLAVISANVSSICDSSTTKRCLAAVASSTARQQRQENDAKFLSCMKNQFNSVPQCVSTWVEGDRSAASIDSMINVFCAVNDENTRCLPLLHTASRSPAVANLSKGGRCDAQIAASLAQTISSAGCCLDVLNRASNTDYDPSGLPATTRPIPAHALPNITGASWDTNPVYPLIVACSDAPSFNATALRASASTQCRGLTSPPPQRELRLIGVLWNVVKSDPVVKAKLEASLKSDIEANIGAKVNGSLVEDKTQQLSNSSSTRRQSAQTQSGTKFQFNISGANDADAAANAQAFDSLQANNKLSVPTTATTIQTQCSTCLAAGASNTNLYAGLVGGDTSGTTAPSSSSANGVSMIAAAIVAVLIVNVV